MLRIGFGVLFIMHGAPKLLGGTAMWEKLGMAMGVFGITFVPAFWGFMAASAEFFGGILLLTGFAVRPACFFMLFTMIVAVTTHLAKGDGFTTASHAMKAAVVFASLILMGPGKYSLDDWIKRR